MIVFDFSPIVQYQLMRISLAIVFLLGLLYLILPGPDRIEEFPKLPNSLKSQLAGDTVQNPNIAAYFSDFNRDFVTKFYYQNFRDLYCKRDFYGLPNLLCFIPPAKLNHPPEKAFNYIRDQQESTYLEEYYLPLRESFFVNGYEPIDMMSKPFNNWSKPLEVGTTIYFSKTTIRYYPTPIWGRILIYLAVWVSGYLLIRLTREVVKHG